jgi:hypothetical protein
MIRCQENESDKNKPDDEEVVRQAVAEQGKKGPVEEQNSDTEQKDPDITFHHSRPFPPTGKGYTITNHRRIPYGKQALGGCTIAINDLDFVMYI